MPPARRDPGICGRASRADGPNDGSRASSIGAARGQLGQPAESPLNVVASHRDLSGALLSARVAAVEVLNLLRPIVAVSVFITDAAHALHLNPGCRERLRRNEIGYADLFVQEVRRFYPFFPAVVARV